ncbi:MuDR family transposase [Rhynchospora pubera]|uniref:MuDR family transposase n=1 Tax=Rhynchospora pubera TaxID=906938 RepID=A0AAV8GVM2_9POAL|nr:MuDR family transposase [Rhynchospora pubera]
MFPISIYTGGSVENGPMGATYNKPHSASYPAPDHLIFDDLKTKIFQLTGINKDKNTINVNARWNAGAAGSLCFLQMPICENTMWRMLVDKTLSGDSGWSVIELFVEAVPSSCCTHNDPGDKSQSNLECTQTTPELPTLKRSQRIRESRKNLQELSDEESFDVKQPSDELALYSGRLFDSLDDQRRTIREHHIRQNRNFVTVRSNGARYVVKCLDPRCGWKSYAASSKDRSYCQIKTIKGEHVSSNERDGEDNVNMTTEFISKLILDLVKIKGDACTPKKIQDFVHEVYPCTPSYTKAFRAKELAIAHLFGEWKESYAKLAPYLNAIQVVNPGTKVDWLSDATADPNVRIFRGVAWAFAPAIEGFKSCRPVISIDSTILSGKYGGRMLIAVAYDADDQLLPLAFAVIKDEKDESWSWFMRWLRLEVVGPRPLCVISDPQDSIVSLFDQPDSGWSTCSGQAFHRYCSRYLCENIRSSFKKDYLVKLVKWVSRQNQPSKFRLGMLRILETSRQAHNWLVKVGTRPDEESANHLWSLCEDGGYRFGILSENENECVFNLFPQIQMLPITALVELTFTESAENFASKREAASKIEVEKQLWSNKVVATLEARRAKVSQHRIVSLQSQSFSHAEFEVETRSKV